VSRPLSPASRDRLLKVCRLLASPHAGERAAAALTAARLLERLGLDWDAVIAPAGPPRVRPDPASGRYCDDPGEAAQVAAFRAEVAFIRAHRDRLTRAEQLQFGWYSTVQGAPGPAALQAVAYHARLIRQRLAEDG